MANTFEPQPVEVLCRALAGASGRTARQLLDDETLLHVPGRSGLAGQYQGQEAILGLLGRMTELTDETLRFTPTATLTADDQMIVVCGRSSASRQRKRLNTDTAYVVLWRNDRVGEMWIVHQDQSQFNSFWT